MSHNHQSDRTILAIDQGTTSSRAILFAASGDMLHTAQKELTQHYPHKGWVEQDPEDIWNDTLAVCRDVLKHTDKCAVIGITNQRETTIIWNRHTGKPVYNAIVWQDRRSAEYCATLSAHEDMVAQKTGLRIDPYFSCTKIKWILDTVPDARRLAAQGDLAFGTVDCFLLWRLTGGKVHATDTTNAARTGLFNIITHEWDDALLALYDIPRDLLPEVKENVALFGHTDPSLFDTSIMIGGMAGDQHAALVGQTCFKAGMMKSTYGTGCFALLNIGTQFRTSQHQLLTTPAYRINGQTHYAIEGSIFVAGVVIQWLRDNLGVLPHASTSDELAQSVPDNNGIYFIPAFTGLGAPFWRPDIRGMIYGITRDTSRAHIVRAALEAQAYQTLDLLHAMKEDTGIFPDRLRVDGGLVANRFMCQFLSDMTQIPIEIPHITETTALGAAYLAGLYAGIYSDLEDIAARWHRAQMYTPHTNTETVTSNYAEWRNLVHRLL